MTLERKTAALLCAAEAYLARGCRVQYDQLSMDRIVRVTPRRRFTLPPEAATSRQTLYLDCATYVCAAFYNAFGYMPEADVTWNMRELVQDCVYRYEVTGKETPGEIAAVTAEVRSLLRPGDALIVSRADNGHIMLYADENTYYHCTPGGEQGSYDYTHLRDVHSAHGGLYADDPHMWFERNEDPKKAWRYLFHETVKIFAVVRPLNHVGDITADTLARMSTAKDLFFEVTGSHEGGRTADAGDTVLYTLSVENRRTEAAEVSVRFTPPAGCRFTGSADVSVTIPAGGCTSFDFPVRLESADSVQIAPPVICANGMNVYAPPVLTGKNLTAEEAETVLRTAKAADSAMPERIAAAYRAIGIAVPTEYNRLLRDLFYRHDSMLGDVWSRRVQEPKRDMALYSYFGGIGVITPQTASDLYIRTVQLRMEDLQAGDILLCSDDHTGLRTYAVLYTGSGFFGCFAPDQPCEERTGDAAAAYLDTLPGRYAYVILRPSLSK